MQEIYDIKPIEQGIVQLSAGASLIVSSGLLKWDNQHSQFLPVKSSEFNTHWERFDKIYGRAAMWNIFSTGAELLLKGYLINAGTLVAEPKKVFQFPDNKKLDEWALKLLKTQYQKRETQPAYGYGTIAAALTNFRKHKNIDTTVKVGKVKKGDKEVFVTAAYELLRDSIRNRDTHAYIPNVRSKHGWLANGVFMKAFNILLGYLSDEDRIEVSKAVMKSRPI